jgi:hypothetical protein
MGQLLCFSMPVIFAVPFGDAKVLRSLWPYLRSGEQARILIIRSHCRDRVDLASSSGASVFNADTAQVNFRVNEAMVIIYPRNNASIYLRNVVLRASDTVITRQRTLLKARLSRKGNKFVNLPALVALCRGHLYLSARAVVNYYSNGISFLRLLNSEWSFIPIFYFRTWDYRTRHVR